MKFTYCAMDFEVKDNRLLFEGNCLALVNNDTTIGEIFNIIEGLWDSIERIANNF